MGVNKLTTDAGFETKNAKIQCLNNYLQLTATPTISQMRNFEIMATRICARKILGFMLFHLQD